MCRLVKSLCGTAEANEIYCVHSASVKRKNEIKFENNHNEQIKKPPLTHNKKIKKPISAGEVGWEGKGGVLPGAPSLEGTYLDESTLGPGGGVAREARRRHGLGPPSWAPS